MISNVHPRVSHFKRVFNILSILCLRGHMANKIVIAIRNVLYCMRLIGACKKNRVLIVLWHSSYKTKMSLIKLRKRTTVHILVRGGSYSITHVRHGGKCKGPVKIFSERKRHLRKKNTLDNNEYQTGFSIQPAHSIPMWHPKASLVFCLSPHFHWT